jgi:HAD superfamily hydrolase (TIGR01509 family)
VTPPVEVVLWDIGQVIYPSPFERLADVEQQAGLPAGLLPRGPFATGGDAAYTAVDEGLREEPAYWRDLDAAARVHVPDFDVHLALRALGWRGRARPVVVDLLRDIPARYRQAVLTNDSTAFLGAGWHRDWELRDCVELIVDSVDIGARKPDPAAYAAAVDALAVPAERILFVDDLTVNVRAARDAGLQAYRFDTTDPAGAVSDLRTLLDLP